MTTQEPTRAARQIVELAARTLPAAHRERYRREFTAELDAMPRAEQFRYAARVLTRTWSLRAALGQPALATPGGNTMMTPPTRPLSCRLHLWHHWRRYFTEDGGRYKACSRCGRELSKSWFGSDLAPDRWFS
jgi:hypothetical protein